MSIKLYDIPREIEIFEDRLVNGGGELTPELEADWTAFVSQGKDKLEAAAFVINRIEGDIEVCKGEVKRLQGRAQSSERNVDRLRNLTLYALQSLGGKVKTALISLWVGRSGRQLHIEQKAGTDLVELQKTHPALVRVKHELNLEYVKATYKPLWAAYEARRDMEYDKAGDTLLDADVRVRINDELEAYWKQLLEAKGLPDCFVVTVSEPTEYLVIK